MSIIQKNAPCSSCGTSAITCISGPANNSRILINRGLGLGWAVSGECDDDKGKAAEGGGRN